MLQGHFLCYSNPFSPFVKHVTEPCHPSLCGIFPSCLLMLTGKQSYLDGCLVIGRWSTVSQTPSLSTLQFPSQSASSPQRLRRKLWSPPSHLAVSPSLASFPAHAIHLRRFTHSQVRCCVISLENGKSLGAVGILPGGSIP